MGAATNPRPGSRIKPSSRAGEALTENLNFEVCCKSMQTNQIILVKGKQLLITAITKLGESGDEFSFTGNTVDEDEPNFTMFFDFCTNNGAIKFHN